MFNEQGNQGRCRPRRISVYDVEWAYARHLGAGNASAGFRRMVRCASDFREVRAEILVLSQLAYQTGDNRMGDNLSELCRRIDRIAAKVDSANA